MPFVISLHEVNSFMTISCDDLPLYTPQVTRLPAQGSNSKQSTKTLIITPPKLLGCRQSFSLCKAHRLGTQSWLHSPVISPIEERLPMVAGTTQQHSQKERKGVTEIN